MPDNNNQILMNYMTNQFKALNTRIDDLKENIHQEYKNLKSEITALENKFESRATEKEKKNINITQLAINVILALVTIGLAVKTFAE